jgi:hypothetical protein
MCDSTQLAGRAVTRPRWRVLYGVVCPPLAMLGIVEVAAPAAPVRTVLRLALVLGVVAAMAVWVRANRAALDLQDWCAWAASTITVRVIESQRPAASPGSDPFPASPTWVEEEREVEVASR